jgi:hypothetical protein
MDSDERESRRMRRRSRRKREESRRVSKGGRGLRRCCSYGGINSSSNRCERSNLKENIIKVAKS